MMNLRKLLKALNRAKVVASRCSRKIVTVRPGLDVMNLQLTYRHLRVTFDESLQAISIPLVSVRSSVFFDPCEKRIEKGGEGLWRDSLMLSWELHQSMEFDYCRLPIRAQIVAFAIDGDLPDFSFLVEPRFWRSGHEKTLQTLSDKKPSQQTAGFAFQASASGSSPGPSSL